MLQRSQSAAPVRVLAVGHSHLTAIRRAHRKLVRTGGISGPALDIRYLSLSRNAAPWLVRKLSKWPALYWPLLHWRLAWAILRARPDFVVSCIGGNAHSSFGLLNHPVRFDLVLPEQPDLPFDRSAEILPSSLVTAEMRKKMGPHLDLIIALRARASVPMIHIEAPPPGHSAHIKRFPGAFAKGVETRGVASDALRYKLWRVHAGLVRSVCEQHGIVYLPTPAKTQNRAGMLAQWAAAKDPTHANPRYGRRVLDELTALIERLQAQRRQAPRPGQ